MKILFVSGLIFILLATAGCQPASMPAPAGPPVENPPPAEPPVENSPAPAQPTDTAQPTDPPPPPPPTETPIPSQTTAPTEVPTAVIEPTATPEYLIFRDDFNGSVRPEWTWENENPERWTITNEGWLQILGEDAGLLYGQPQSNLLWTDLPESPFAITVHLQAAPSDNFAQATIYIYEDLNNFIAINRGFCGPCRTGGNGIYMEYKINGQGAAYAVPFSETDLYLKLEDKDNVISGYYATSPDQWERLGRFGNYFKFKRVGLGVTNADQGGAINNDLTGLFDYFEIRKP